MRIHKDVTFDRVLNAAQSDEHLGFCVSCGADAFEVEPDAREYTCEVCGCSAVYGAEELLFYMT